MDSSGPREIEVPGSDIFFPTDSSKRVTSVIPESGRPLQSAAKVPIMVSFNTEQWIESEHRARVHPQVKIAFCFLFELSLPIEHSRTSFEHAAGVHFQGRG